MTNEQEAGLSAALTALAYQLDSWASTGLLGTGVLAHTPQTDTGRHVASPADPDAEVMVLSAGDATLRFRSAGGGAVQLDGPGQQAALRLAEDGTWLTPDGEALSAEWLRGLLGTSAGGEREGQL